MGIRNRNKGRNPPVVGSSVFPSRPCKRRKDGAPDVLNLDIKIKGSSTRPGLFDAVGFLHETVHVATNLIVGDTQAAKASGTYDAQNPQDSSANWDQKLNEKCAGK